MIVNNTAYDMVVNQLTKRAVQHSCIICEKVRASFRYYLFMKYLFGNAILNSSRKIVLQLNAIRQYYVVINNKIT